MALRRPTSLPQPTTDDSGWNATFISSTGSGGFMASVFDNSSPISFDLQRY
jgi:hypothetical protein